MREYPIVKFWYGKGARYNSIEELIDNSPGWFIWAVEKFQNVSPTQAKHFQEKYNMDLPPEVIEDVPPYEHIKGDPPELYQELCDTFPRPTLDDIYLKYRKR